MRLASLDDGRDGRLIVISRDGARYLPGGVAAPTLQAALDDWDIISPDLQALAVALERGQGEALDVSKLAAPLPRAWQWLDGSAYPSHGALMDKVLGISAESGGRPLMYQGMSDHFLPPTADVPLPAEDDGIDFEGEFGVIVGDVPMGVSAEAALAFVRLVVQINDWSLRALAGPEMTTGFGWVQAKPACSMAPFAVTPESLGPNWNDGRVQMRLRVERNAEIFGDAHGGAMAFGFGGLIAHAARTRRLSAGTVIGSGTVSNDDYRTVGSSCIAERRGIEIVDEGAVRTLYMKFGERVRMEAIDASGWTPFGAINQRVVRPG
jgi:fumarylacetoacetate (FAA) hydrolase